MRILVVGGTRFVGRHFTDAALDAGHDVTVLHRGTTNPGLFEERGATSLTADRDGDLSVLAPDAGAGPWDATVDFCAYVPRQVRTLARVLDGRGGHHLLVSSVSAYATPPGPGLTEDAPLATLDDPTTEEVTGETYGGLKALCEQAAVEEHGSGTLLVRPTYVVGPEDYTWRFPWWVRRIAAGGVVPVPEPAEGPFQLVDGRDLGAWMVRLLEDGRSGAFHGVGPRRGWTWGDTVEAVAQAVAPPGTELRWAGEDAVRAAGLADGAFPLWLGDDPDAWVMAADPARAFESGLAPRPVVETARDTWEWARRLTVPAGTGVTPEQEQLLLG